MRYVRLNTESTQSPYAVIIKNGCGPNFVFNRVDAFETMIKEQGITFWFRFWLKFCLIPGCNDLKAIQEQWPDIKSYANINIHEQFLHGSVEDAIKFCLETALTKLKVSDIRSISEDGCISKKSFYALLQECSEIAFGASLCDMFYTWLISKESSKDSLNYWSLPKVYLNPEFKPGLLEQFLMKRWGENLLGLLGACNGKTIPWVIDWNRYQRKLSLHENVSRSEHPMSMQNIAEVLKTHRDQRRLETDIADELPNAPKNFLTLNMLNDPPEDVTSEAQVNALRFSHAVNSNKTQQLSKMSSKIRHRCAFCNSCELVRNTYKKCKRCQFENWLDPRFYCCSSCEVEHWFQSHQREHLKMEKESDQI